MERNTKVVSRLIATIMILVTSGISSFAEDGYSYDDGTQTLTVSKNFEYSSNQDYPWYGCRISVKSVVIEDGVTSIGNSAFEECRNLTSVVIPKNVKSIGNSAFSNCYALASVTLPDGLESIGNSAFYNCRSLSSVVIPKNVKSIGDLAFYNCWQNLSSITLPESLTSIGNSAFAKCDRLCSMYICGDSLLFVDDNVFDANVCGGNSTLYVKKGLKQYYEKMDGWNHFGNIVELNKVSLSSSNEKCGKVEGNGLYADGTVTIKATPNEHCMFEKWSDGNSDAERTISINDNLTLVALFDSLKFEVNISAGENGSVEYGNISSVYYGKTINVKAVPDENCHFVKWSNGSVRATDTILVVSDTAIVAEFAPHQYGKWDTTLVATCTMSGLRTHVCACGEVKTDTIAALGHKVVADSAVAATCSSTGLTEGKHCSVCDSVLVAQQTVAKLAHTVVVDSAVAATCTATGLTEGKHCSVCDSVLVAQQTVVKIAHTVVVDSAVAATCTATGLTEGKHCSVCVSVFVAQQTVAKIAHIVVVDSAVAATCTATGLTEGSHCSVCDSVFVAQQTVPALGHLFTNYISNPDATPDADGTETAVCDHGCGATDTRTAEGTKLTDIDATETAEVVIYAHHNVIVVENAENDIYVFDVNGKMLVHQDANAGRIEMHMAEQGLYIVKVGDESKRLVLK